jgi:hypothetical protein
MGRESRGREHAEVAHLSAVLLENERRMGPVRRHGIHDNSGCPKCGQKELRKIHHSYSPLNEQDPCRMVPEHLHTTCATCGFAWREQVRDCDDEGRVTECAQAGDVANMPAPVGAIGGIVAVQRPADA